MRIITAIYMLWHTAYANAHFGFALPRVSY